MSLALDLESKIIENGTIEIDSIFRFSEEPQDLPAFLGLCDRKSCTVKFMSEGLVCEPKKDIFMKDDGEEVWSALFITSFIAYMTFYKKFAGKHFDYLMNLASKKDDFAKGV